MLSPLDFPQSPFWRRAAAFGLDWLVVWLLAVLLGGRVGWLQGVIFLISWLVWRVVIPQRQYGQSLGRWALDIRLASLSTGRTPDLQTLLKREGLVGLGTLLATVSVPNLLATNAAAMLLALPLLVDWVYGLADRDRRQTLHDFVAGTFVVLTRRGFSLDIKLRRILDLVRQRVKQ